MYLYEAPRAKDMTRLDAAWWLADQTGITPDPALPVTRWLDIVFDTLPQLAAPGVVEEDAPLMAWWRQWAAEGGYRRA